MSIAALDWVADFWFPALFAAVGAALVVGPIWLAYRRERRNARSKSQFAIDQFDYTLNWATGYLTGEKNIPPEVREVLQRYSAAMREAFSLDSFQIHQALPVPIGKGGSADDPLKMLHLLFARLEAGVSKEPVMEDDLLCGKLASSYLKVLLDLDPDNRHEYVIVLRLAYAAAEREPGREVVFLLKMLIDAGPSAVRDEVVSASAVPGS